MALLSFLFPPKTKTASMAKERLQIIIARERNGSPRLKPPNFLKHHRRSSRGFKVKTCYVPSLQDGDDADAVDLGGFRAAQHLRRNVAGVEDHHHQRGGAPIVGSRTSGGRHATVVPADQYSEPTYTKSFKRIH